MQLWLHLTFHRHNLQSHPQPTGVLPGFCLFFQSDGVDLVQIEDMQLDALMDAGRWIYLTSVKPDAVLTDNSVKKP